MGYNTTLIIPEGKIVLLSVNLVFLGVFVLPIIPLGYSFSVELTYPVSEPMSNGIMILISQLVGTVVSIIGSYIC